MKKSIALLTVSIEYPKNSKISCINLKMTAISCIFGKTFVLSIICSKCENEDEKLFKEEESIKVLKILGLIKNI